LPQKRANAFSFECSIKLGVGVFVGYEAIISNGRSTLVIDDLKRPAFVTLDESINFDANGKAVATHGSAQGRIFDFRIFVDHNHMIARASRTTPRVDGSGVVS
jgi:hypothetical protein